MEVDVAVGRREEGKKGRRETGDGTGALHDFTAQEHQELETARLPPLNP
jgi:hypothetical protein